jgi:hypothetical protein
MADSDMRTWALKGAEQRLLEIAEEAARIYAQFPELRDRAGSMPGRGRTPRGSGGRAAGDNVGRPARRPRTMSAEARKRISDAQKARWARQKAGSQAAPPAAAKSASARKKR